LELHKESSEQVKKDNDRSRQNDNLLVKEFLQSESGSNTKKDYFNLQGDYVNLEELEKIDKANS